MLICCCVHAEVASSIINWLQDNELSDIQGRDRAYAAVRALWQQARQPLPLGAEEDIGTVAANDKAYSDMVGSLVSYHCPK